MGKIYERQFDSNSYRKLLEFIKEQETTEKLIAYFKELNSISDSHIKHDRIFKGNDRIGALIRKYKEISKFLRECPNGFLSMENIQNKKFIEFLISVNSQLGNIDLFIDNAKALETLNFGTVTITDNPAYSATNGLNSYIFFDEEGNITDIRKIYSDLDEKLYYSELEPSSLLNRNEEYHGYFNGNPNWILVAENNARNQWRYAFIKDFGFDASKLPSEEELGSYKEPLTLRKFKKDNPERKNYTPPF